MRKIILLLILLFMPTFVKPQRDFQGKVDIEIINPTYTELKICTPNEKYLMEPGTKNPVRLYVRNDMENKTIGRIYLEIESDDIFTFEFFPNHLENITTNMYRYFDINVTVNNYAEFGNYRVDFLIGTDEYMVGSLRDEIMIKVRPYSNEMQYFFIGVIALISVTFITRYFWIRQLNKRAKKHKKKSVS